jgi:hypothetical protein
VILTDCVRWVLDVQIDVQAARVQSSKVHKLGIQLNQRLVKVVRNVKLRCGLQEMSHPVTSLECGPGLLKSRPSFVMNLLGVRD